MIRKILYVIVLVPLAVLLIAFSVANRQPVDFSYDPLGGFTYDPVGGDPTMQVTLPLFVLLLSAILIGILAGGIAAWLRQGKWRRTARLNAQEAARWQREAQEWRQRLEESARRALPEAPPQTPPETPPRTPERQEEPLA